MENRDLHYTQPPRQQIPHVLHFVWVGDESRRPDWCIDSWRKHYPDWTIKVWGNEEYKNRPWRMKEQMEVMWKHELSGVADMMRWEILADEGGVASDADAFCLKKLPEWVTECEAFCVAENEVHRPGLLAAGFVGTIPKNPFFIKLVDTLATKKDLIFYRRQFRPWMIKRNPAWVAVGPLPLTNAVRKEKYSNMTVLPSHFLYPTYKDDQAVYSGGGPVYAQQLWSSTTGQVRTDTMRQNLGVDSATSDANAGAGR